MAADSPSPSERIVSAFAQLNDSAKNINAVSAELGRPIVALEAALAHLKLGVACWATISEYTESDHFWREYVGYAEIQQQWCLAVRTEEGADFDPENTNVRLWSFNEAPHHLRVKAVDKLPDLVEALVKASDATAERLKKKIEPAQEFASAVSEYLKARKK